MNGFEDYIISNLSEQLNLKKEEIIKDKFNEIGLSHLLENLNNSRFKRVIIEVDGEFERWYADNGTIEGLLVITFINELPSVNFDDNRIIMASEIKYF